jgi:hypothetical protein
VARAALEPEVDVARHLERAKALAQALRLQQRLAHRRPHSEAAMPRMPLRA